MYRLKVTKHFQIRDRINTQSYWCEFSKNGRPQAFQLFIGINFENEIINVCSINQINQQMLRAKKAIKKIILY